MKLIKHIFNEIFDFFCGDWRIFWGIAITIILVALIDHLDALSFIKPASVIIFIIGVVFSLVIALKCEISN